MNTHPRLSYFVRGFIFFAAYFLTGILGLKIGAVSGLATSIWAPSGIALACLLKYGPAFWPSIFLGAFSVNLFMDATFFSALGISIGNTLEALTAFYLLSRYCRLPLSLDKLSHVVSLLLFGAFFSTMISAGFGVVNLWLTSLITPGQLSFTFLTWWLGDAMGILVVTPFLLAWSASYKNFAEGILANRQKTLRLIEAFALMGFLILVSYSIFMDGRTTEPLKPHFIFPILIWSAISFGQRGATLSFLVLSAIAIYGTANGHGPFAVGVRTENLFSLQGYMAIISFSSLILAAIIAERRAIEKLLKTNAQELVRSNAELEQFASLASHDLQEPLRTISIRMEMLKEHLSDKADSETKEHIDFCTAAARRLQTLILALLNYAQTGKKNPTPSRIDLNQEIKRVLEFMQTEIDREEAVITLDPLPTMMGDRILMGQVFQNLISNALKFRRSEKPKIYIGVREMKNECIFFVKDNGIGFPAKYSENIFKIFQRLHSSDEVAGTGVGLALCKKIIEKHDGRIWAKSEEGKGSTFYFAIPKQPRLSKQTPVEYNITDSRSE